ncbi:MAG: cytochrome c oxidase accessory protein CcoG [Alphaproteobacteria bacterium]|nr:cytochrome c oxidase accessory protein CcoG [Alphaproteobacteria bacterium]
MTDKSLSEADAPKIKFFEKARRIYPKDITGTFRRLKWAVMAVLLAIYYFTPFIRFDRGPHVPSQAILIDMEGRRAYFFMFEIWSQEVYYFAGILILAALFLFFATSLFGRVWCGYACPQTVWTDLFVKVEHFIQGDHVARQRLDKGQWNFNKIWRKVVTHILWIVIGAATGGAWTLYFTDAPTLIDQIIHLSVPWQTQIWIYALTASTYIMAGFAREQVCAYMCPYARFQSGMFDRGTLIISYDKERGEPRGSHKKGDSWDNRGACVDCNACVQVCPVGIDIRNGLQYQCIACGLCIDACNDIMDKVGLPGNLIRYDTANNQEARAACHSKGEVFKEKNHLLRPRTIYYVCVMTLVCAIMLYSLLGRAPFTLNVLHERNPLFVTLSDGSVRNSYKIHILNRNLHDQTFALSVNGVDVKSIKILAATEVEPEKLGVLADSVGEFRVTVAAELPSKEVRRDIEFVIRSTSDGSEARTKTMFIGKAQ